MPQTTTPLSFPQNKRARISVNKQLFIALRNSCKKYAGTQNLCTLRGNIGAVFSVVYWMRGVTLQIPVSASFCHCKYWVIQIRVFWNGSYIPLRIFIQYLEWLSDPSRKPARSHAPTFLLDPAAGAKTIRVDAQTLSPEQFSWKMDSFPEHCKVFLFKKFSVSKLIRLRSVC